MSIVLLEGFEDYGPVGTSAANLEAAMQTRWTQANVVNGGNTMSQLTAGRYAGGKALEMLYSEQIYQNSQYHIAFENNDYVVIGVAFYYCAKNWNTSGWPINDFWMGFTKGGSTQLECFIRWMGTFTLRAGSTDLAYGQLKTGGWHYYEFKIHFAASGSIEIRIDGEVVTTVTGIDTRGTGGSGCDGLWIGAQKPATGNGTWKYDDLYVATGATQDYLGPIVIESVRPDSDQTTDWSTTGANHYSVVNEAIFDVNSYVSSGTLDAVDKWGCTSLSIIDSAVSGIQVVATGKINAAGVRNLEVLCDSNGSEVANAFNLCTPSEMTSILILDVDPDTSSAWTINAVNVANFGLRVGD